MKFYSILLLIKEKVLTGLSRGAGLWRQLFDKQDADKKDVAWNKLRITPLQSIGAGILFSIILALLLGAIPVFFLGSPWWFAVAFLIALARFLFGSLADVPIEHRAAYTFLDNRIVTETEENLPNDEKIIVKEGPEAEEGIQWVPPFFSLLMESVQDTPVPSEEKKDLNWKTYAKDGVELGTHLSGFYKVVNVHQFQSVGRATVEKGLIDLMELVTRTSIKSRSSKYWLFGSKSKNSLAKDILKEAKSVERRWGIDMISVFVGDFDTDPEITRAFRLKQQNRLYKEARDELKNLPGDEAKEVSQTNMGIAEPKKVSETKFDIGATLSKAVENIGQGIGEGIGRSIGEVVSKNMADKITKEIKP